MGNVFFRSKKFGNLVFSKSVKNTPIKYFVMQMRLKKMKSKLCKSVKVVERSRKRR